MRNEEVPCVGEKGAVYPRTIREDPEGENMYSPILSLISTLDGCGWLTPRLDHFTPGKETRYALYRRLGGPQGRSGRVWKISPPPGFDRLTVQTVASHYTDHAIPVHVEYRIFKCFKLSTCSYHRPFEG